MSIDDKTLREAAALLNSCISNLVYGGASDPGSGELLNAANIYNVLKLLNLRVKNENDIHKILSGKNINKYNYLENRKAEDGNL